MKSKIKKLLLSIMLLFGTAQIQSSDITKYNTAQEMIEALDIKNKLPQISCVELDDIIKQSGTTKNITFLEGPMEDNFGGFYSAPNIIFISKKYSSPQHIINNAATILHEIGHVINDDSTFKYKFEKHNNRAVRIFLAMSAFFPIKHKYKMLLGLATFSTSIAAGLLLTRKVEYRADTFMLEKATKEQLLNRLQIMKIDYKEQKQAASEFIPALNALLNLDQKEYILNLLFKGYPSTPSRIQRIKDRIQELTEIEDEIKLMRARL